MSINWIPKIQEKQNTLYPNCEGEKNIYLYLKGLHIPYIKTPGRAWISLVTIWLPILSKRSHDPHSYERNFNNC